MQVLINVSGSQQSPAHHIRIQNLTLRDTAYTYMDPHGQTDTFRFQHST